MVFDEAVGVFDEEEGVDDCRVAVVWFAWLAEAAAACPLDAATCGVRRSALCVALWVWDPFWASPFAWAAAPTELVGTWAARLPVAVGSWAGRMERNPELPEPTCPARPCPNEMPSLL